jgi:hypothetical protein
MTCRDRSSRENRRFSSVEKRPEDFFHGQLGAPSSGERHRQALGEPPGDLGVEFVGDCLGDVGGVPVVG